VRARWSTIVAADAALALLESSRKDGGATIALEGARNKARWPREAPFARRLLDAGAKQLLVLGPPP
jgi:hypothetical protein